MIFIEYSKRSLIRFGFKPTATSRHLVQTLVRGFFGFAESA
jgi:hypothetical protein